MRGEPFTDCRLRVAWGEVPGVDVFLLARTIAYRVNRVCGRTLYVTRWPLDEVPGDAEVWAWVWAPRGPTPRALGARIAGAP